MTPSQVGERAEAAAMAALVSAGKWVHLGSPRNNQRRGIRWAEQYRLDWEPPALDADAQVVLDPPQ